MRDKSLCWTCKYHTYLGNLPSEKYKGTFDMLTELEVANIACYYSVIERSSALKPDGVRKTIDLRGEEPGCNLYDGGKRDRDKAKHDFTNDEGMRRRKFSYDR